VAVFLLTCNRSAGGGVEYWSVDVKARVVNRKQVDVGAEIVPVVLECANCLLHGMVWCALSETVAMVSLSTVPRLSRQSCRLRVWKGTRAGEQAVWPT